MIEANISLKPYHSFGVDVTAKAFARFDSTALLQQLLRETVSFRGDNLLILGGGSNLLFTKDFPGLVLKNEIGGIELVSEGEDFVYVRAGAGVNWHGFVLHCIQNNWGGLENLSLIPGCVGAGPMQNIGAYGVEIKDVFHGLEAFHLHEQTLVDFQLNDCHFGYRESVFKRQYKNQFVITSVSFRLRKHPVINSGYGAIAQELAAMQVVSPTIKNISDAVIRIRQSKLPDPKILGNAGSFFKNPVIFQAKYDDLLTAYPQIPGFKVVDEPNGTTNRQPPQIKVSAAWLIEQCGFKGFRQGDAGVHTRQALVLVNYGGASGTDILALSSLIIEAVVARFGITLEREVNII